MKETFHTPTATPEAAESMTLAQLRARIKHNKKRIEEIHFEKGARVASVDPEHAALTEELSALEEAEHVRIEQAKAEKEAKKAAAAAERKIKRETQKMKAEIEEKKARIKVLEKGNVTKNQLAYNPSTGKVEAGDIDKLEKEIYALEDKIRALRGEAKPAPVETLEPEPAPETGVEETTAPEPVETPEPAAPTAPEAAPSPTLAELLDKARKDKEREDAERAKLPPGKRKLGIVQTDLLEKRAREAAAERMNRNKSELKGVSGFFKKVWTHNWMAEYYRAKEMEKVREELGEAGSVLGESDTKGEGDKKIKDAIITRFLENQPGLVHEGAGEWKGDESHITPEQRAAAERDIKFAIRTYATNKALAAAEGNLTEAINRVYMTLYMDDKDRKAGGFEPLNVADNIKEYAREIRAQVEHGTAIADIDLDFELTFGKAVTGARTEEAYTWRDRMIEKMAKSPVGRFVNETTIAAGVCAAIAGGNLLRGVGMRAAGLGILGGLGLGGGLAAVRESQATKRDRAEHARAMASGRTYNEKESPRRKEINETTYEMLPVRSTIDQMRALMRGSEGVSGAGMSEDDVIKLVALVGSVDSRIAISDTKKLDLLSYSNPNDFEIERTELDIERATAKAEALKAWERLGLDDKFGIFENYMASQTVSSEARLLHGEGSIEAKDKTFEALRKRRMKNAFIKGVATGAAVGVAAYAFREAVQEVSSLIHPHTTGGRVIHIPQGASPHAHGSSHLRYAHIKVAGLLDGEPSTPAEMVALPGQDSIHSAMVNGTQHEITNTIAGRLRVPEGFHVVKAPGVDEYRILAGGHFDVDGNLVDSKLVAEHISFDTGTTGHPGSFELTPRSIDTLQKAGIVVGSHSETATTAEHFETTETKTLTPNEYAAQHPDEFRQIHRIGWADNNTVKPDLNELRLQDPVLGKDGMIHISIRPMTHHGSTIGRHHLDVPKLIKAGKMECWMSASHDSQFTPAHVPFGPDGTAVLDPNSAAGKLFKFDAHGRVIERPMFTEAAAVASGPDGLKHGIVCATDEGKDLPGILSEVKGTGIKEHVVKTVTTDLAYFAPEDKIVLLPDVITTPPEIIIPPTVVPDNHDWIPPVVPFTWRSPLERLSKEDTSVAYYNLRASKERIKEWESKFSETLRNNPKAKLDQAKEVKQYLQRQEDNDSLGYEYIKELDDRIADSKLNKLVTSKTKMIVCMPVHGPSEAENIYNTLSQYAHQKDKSSLKETAVLLNINWREHEKDNVLCKKTIAEVERAKKDFPELNVGYFTKEWSTEYMAAHRGLLSGSVQKHLFDTALRMIDQSGTKQEVYLASNDADSKGMSGDYLRHLLDEEAAHPNKDAFFGKIEWGSEEFTKYPGYHVSMRVMQYLNMVKRNTKDLSEKNIESSGANFTCKASMYAAVGGFDSGTGAGADVDLGQRIRHARLGFDTEDTTDAEKLESYPIGFVNRAWIDTDPARALGEYVSGRPLANMWQEWNKGGYKPRDVVAIEKGTEENLENFDEISERVQEQINAFLNGWGYSKKIYVKALNHLLPPRGGVALWENAGTDDRPDIVINPAGRAWLKEQLVKYRDSKRADIKYDVAGGVR